MHVLHLGISRMLKVAMLELLRYAMMFTTGMFTSFGELRTHAFVHKKIIGTINRFLQYVKEDLGLAVDFSTTTSVFSRNRLFS